MSENLTPVNLENLKMVTLKVDDENEKVFKHLERKIKLLSKQYEQVVEQNKSLQLESSKYFALIELISNYLKTFSPEETSATSVKEHISGLIEGVMNNAWRFNRKRN